MSNTERYEGYGRDRETGALVCFVCCGERDRQTMIETGSSRRLPLYLVSDAKGHKVTNWSGTLVFRVGFVWTGRHNIAGRRYDFDFNGPDGHVWHGTQYGDNTQIAHCRRTKERA